MSMEHPAAIISRPDGLAGSAVRICPCVSCAGPVYKYDLSVPIGEMYNLVEETRQRVAGHQDVQARRSTKLVTDEKGLVSFGPA